MISRLSSAAAIALCGPAAFHEGLMRAQPGSALVGSRPEEAGLLPGGTNHGAYRLASHINARGGSRRRVEQGFEVFTF